MKIFLGIIGYIVICVAAAPHLDTSESACFAAQASSKQDAAAAREEARIDRLWAREWPKFAMHYGVCGEQYVCVPDYARGYGGEDRLPTREHIRETAYELEYNDLRGRTRTLPVTMPPEEADAALWLLDAPEPGQLGYIHSGLVCEIIDEETVVIDNVMLVDWAPIRAYYRDKLRHLEAQAIEILKGRAPIDPDRPRAGIVHDSRREMENFEQCVAALFRDMRTALAFQYEQRLAAARLQDAPAFAQRRWRIEGYPTQDMMLDARWAQGENPNAGIKLVILEIEADGTVVAAPMGILEQEMTEVQFIDVMQERQVSKAQFYDWVMDARREHRQDYLRPVLDRIEANAPSRQIETTGGTPGDLPHLGDEQTSAPPADRNPAGDGSDNGTNGADDQTDDQADDESGGDGSSDDPEFFGVPVE